MQALVFDTQYPWDRSRGFEKVEVPEPTLDETQNPSDRNAVLLKVHYAGVCGSDRGIWFRSAFRDQILGSLKEEGKTMRVIGHEVFGEVLETGSAVTSVKQGDMASCESHVICRECFQCKNGQENVCSNQKILGISHDGGFAEFVKVPEHIVWKTDTEKIRPEVAVMQEPFGNAVHAASKADLKGKTVLISGLGPIGSFLVLIVKGLGAKTVIGIEPNENAIAMGKELGVDYVVKLPSGGNDHRHSAEVLREVMELTNGEGVDVAFEMSGFNDSVNNALYATRRGGDVILFGVKVGDLILEDFTSLVMKGVTLHAVAGRQMWKTWETTRSLLEGGANGIQEKLWSVLLKNGEGTILPFPDYTKELFEKKMLEHPKIIMQFS